MLECAKTLKLTYSNLEFQNFKIFRGGPRTPSSRGGEGRGGKGKGGEREGSRGRIGKGGEGRKGTGEGRREGGEEWGVGRGGKEGRSTWALSLPPLETSSGYAPVSHVVLQASQDWI